MVRRALAIEREVEDVQSIQGTGARGKKKTISLLLVQERSRRLLLPEDFRDGATTIRARQNQGFQIVRTDDMFSLHQPRHVRRDYP